MIYRANINKKPQDSKSEKVTDPTPAQAPAETLGYNPEVSDAMRPISTYNRKQNGNADIIIENEPVVMEESDKKKAPKADKPKRKFKFNFKLFFGLVVLFLAVIGGLFAYDRISSYSSRVETFNEDGSVNNSCDNILNPKCWTDAFKPQLKQSDGFTSVLIIGTDTRAGSGSLMNTDSIIVLTFNHKTQEFMLTSIPRDFWSHSYSTKINAVYAITYQNAKKKHNDEFYFLKEEISKIVDKPIQYTAKVRFEGVTGLVDRLGGIEVCPVDAFTAKYPNDDAKKNGGPQWLSFEFTKGCQTVDGNKALVYSRFRYLYKGPGYLASDFSRGHRQQEVINSIKTKALADNLTIEQRAETYWSLFQSFNEIIEVDITFEDMLAGLSYLDTFDRTPMSVVLDPNFGGINNFIYTDSNPSQGYTIKCKSKDYSNLHNELDKIWKYSAFYKETPKIAVRNQTGNKDLAKDSAAVTLKSTSYYSMYQTFTDAKSDKLAGVHLFDFTNGEKKRSLEFLKTYLGVTTVETLPEQYGIARSNKNEDFLIVVGPDTIPTPTTAPEATVAPTGN